MTFIPRSTHTAILTQRIVEPSSGVMSPGLPCYASMRPKRSGIGLSLPWATHCLIFMMFGEFAYFVCSHPPQPNGAFRGNSDGAIVISRSNTPYREPEGPYEDRSNLPPNQSEKTNLW